MFCQKKLKICHKGAEGTELAVEKEIYGKKYHGRLQGLFTT